MRDLASLLKGNPELVGELAQLLASYGQNGDTILAHINPQEAQLLHKVTDGGRINPHTGLPAFDDGSWGDSGDGSSGAGDWAGSAGPGEGEGPGPGPGEGEGPGPGPGDDGGASMSDGTNVNNQDARSSVAADMAAQGWDSSTSDGSNIRGDQIANEQSFMNSVGRGIGNSILGYVGLHNPGPMSRGAGMMASPGFGFNPGALAGSYLGLATGTPFLGELGARGFNAMNNGAMAAGAAGIGSPWDFGGGGYDPQPRRIA